MDAQATSCKFDHVQAYTLLAAKQRGVVQQFVDARYPRSGPKFPENGNSSSKMLLFGLQNHWPLQRQGLRVTKCRLWLPASLTTGSKSLQSGGRWTGTCQPLDTYTPMQSPSLWLYPRYCTGLCCPDASGTSTKSCSITRCCTACHQSYSLRSVHKSEHHAPSRDVPHLSALAASTM